MESKMDAGQNPSPSTRRSPCPTWLCFVALHADHSLQFSSRPPSSRAFLVGSAKSTRVVARPTYLCRQTQAITLTTFRPHFQKGALRKILSRHDLFFGTTGRCFVRSNVAENVSI